MGNSKIKNTYEWDQIFEYKERVEDEKKKNAMFRTGSIDRPKYLHLKISIEIDGVQYKVGNEFKDTSAAFYKKPKGYHYECTLKEGSEDEYVFKESRPLI